MFQRSLLFILSITSFACVDHASTDPRTFHCEVLNNGLTLLLVEDPNATESAAAMYVDVGSNENPEGREGLAHFLEHMLFITTKEYPEVDALSEYVSSHGGSYNAYTAEHRTQYFFSVKPEYFQEGLNIFTSFFVEPLFEEDYVDRERHAVNSEFIVSKENDGWRQYHLTKTLLSKHPANRFTTGDLNTLEMEGLRDDLVEFYNTYYSADKMYFAAVVPHNAKEILPIIKERLSLIEKKKTKIKDTSSRFSKEDLGRIIQYKPINDMDVLDIEFVLPSGKQQYLKPSARYLSRLLGNEGIGSIIHALREADLATELLVSSGYSTEAEDTFNVTIKLTRKGLEARDEVISAVMSYIQLIKTKGVERFRFNEMQKVSFLNYLYYNQQDALTQVNQLVGNMKDYPEKKWYNINYMLEDSEFDSSHIQLLLSQLRLDNALVVLVSKSAEVNEVEPIYGSEYSVSKITEAQYAAWNKESDLSLALPNLNAFISDNIELLDIEDTSTPIQISEESWYKYGGFKQPKQMIACAKVLPSQSSQDVVQLLMLTRLLEQEKMTSLYPAIDAGGSIHVGYDEQGITIQVGGMGHKQPLVLSQAIRSLYNLEKVSELQFNQAKKDLITSLQNIENQTAYTLLLYQLDIELTPSSYHYKILLKELDKMTLMSFKKSLSFFLSESKNQRFYYGNIGHDSVHRLNDSIVVDYKPVRVAKGDTVLEVKSSRSDNAVILYYQAEDNSDRDKLCSAILAHMIQPHMFRQLRTEEQMGYIVAARYREINRWPGIAYLVQSPDIPVQDIKSRIEAFLKEGDFWEEEAFNSIKSSMILDLEKPFKTMGEEFSFYWNQIHTGQFDYDKKQRLRSELDNISLEDIVEYYTRMQKHPRQLSLLTG